MELSEEIAEKCRQIVAQTPFLTWLGVELKALAKGSCTLGLALRPEHLQQDGFVHAGLQATLADHACGTAAGSCMQPDERVLSIEFKQNMLKPAQGEYLEAVAQVIRAGRRIVVVEADVYCQRGELCYACARMLATMAVVTGGD